MRVNLGHLVKTINKRLSMHKVITKQEGIMTEIISLKLISSNANFRVDLQDNSLRYQTVVVIW